ncbi:MAG: ABC transporter permease [Bacteroidaceae bacterium]|nr:ABC transporter permease [Bacteroidaceae bacterium]
MNLSLYIAKRYLFSKKSHQVINIISGVAVAGVALATMAMVCTLSVFNGFQGIVEKQFTAFDPQLKITATKGKCFDASEASLAAVASLPQVSIVTRCIEDKAMVQYDGRQAMITLKGVEDNFEQLTDIRKALIGNGTFILSDSTTSYAICGGGLVSALNCGIYHTRPLEIYAPRRGRKVSLANPASNFAKGHLHSSGVIFAVQQPKYDNNYLLTSIDFAREIFGRGENEASSIEISLHAGCDEAAAIKEIEALLGEDFVVKDRYRQQEDIFKIMKIEKFISYIFLSFILLIACFNIIGSLSMLVIEKKRDVSTLRSMGADNSLITNIFVAEGAMISIFGAAIGIAAGVLLCLLQEHFGLLTMGGGGNFVVDSYPVAIHWSDVLATFATVIVVGLVAVGLPTRLLTRRVLSE